MLRRLFTILSVLSLLLCVGTCILCVRSYRASNSIYWQWKWTDGEGTDGGQGGLWSFHERAVAIGSGRGGISLTIGTTDYPPWHIAHEVPWRSWWITGDTREPRYGDQSDLRPPWRTAGFLTYADIESEQTLRVWWAPYYLPILLTATAPVLWFVRRRRASRRAALGRCPTCGYDVRATPGRCPECGGAPAR